MRRVLVIGSGGAGKSTFAVALGRRAGLPVIHLDALYWRPGWVEAPPDEWRATVARAIAGEAWVMDGNYGGTLAERLAAADTAIFLDLPRTLCLARVVLRWLRHAGRTRPDMAPGCPEQLTWEFVRWIWSYPRDRRPDVLRRLAALPPSTQAIVLRSPREVSDFLAAVRVRPDRPRTSGESPA